MATLQIKLSKQIWRITLFQQQLVDGHHFRMSSAVSGNIGFVKARAHYYSMRIIRLFANQDTSCGGQWESGKVNHINSDLQVLLQFPVPVQPTQHRIIKRNNWIESFRTCWRASSIYSSSWPIRRYSLYVHGYDQPKDQTIMKIPPFFEVPAKRPIFWHLLEIKRM